MPPRAYVLALSPLLAAGLAVTRRGNSTPSACDCVPWQDAYHKHGMVCGDGHELDLVRPVPAALARLIPQLGTEFCKEFFGRLPNEGFCLKKSILGTSPDQWCYVSRECAPRPTALAAFTGQLKTGLAKKACDAGRDKTLGSMSFESFAGAVYSNKLELGLAVQFAYPSIPGAVLPDVMQFWGLTPPASLIGNRTVPPLSDALRQRLQEQTKSGKPMLITSGTGHPPFGVSEGKKLYWVNLNEKTKKMLDAGTPLDDIFAHREDMSSWRCVAGCWLNSSPF